MYLGLQQINKKNEQPIEKSANTAMDSSQKMKYK